MVTIRLSGLSVSSIKHEVFVLVEVSNSYTNTRNKNNKSRPTCVCVEEEESLFMLSNLSSAVLFVCLRN